MADLSGVLDDFLGKTPATPPTVPDVGPWRLYVADIQREALRTDQSLTPVLVFGPAVTRARADYLSAFPTMGDHLDQVFAPA